MRTRHFLVLVVVASLAAGCYTKPKPRAEDPWQGQYLAAHRVVSQARGTVGFVKTWEYSKPGAGEPFRLFHVYDLNFVERGVVSPMGTGTKYVELPPEIARAKDAEREDQALPAQPLEYNVGVILDVDPGDVKLVRISPAELAALGE
jgi:hypothetical protein